jgi:polar amino acid transport system permease protein
MANVFDAKLIFTNIPELLKYLPVTLEIAFLSYLLSLIVGLMVALIRIKKPRVLYQITCFYVSFTRGTPAIVQLYATYFGMPMILQLINYKFGTSFSTSFIPNIVFALVALTFNDAAYSSEYIRASIESVDNGQREAAHSIGMTTAQTLRRIVIPEALVVAMPSLGNSLISMIMGTSLVFTCAIVDITAGGKLIAARNYRYFEMYISLAIVYWIITIVVAKIFGSLEKLVKHKDTEPDKKESEVLAVNDSY